MTSKGEKTIKLHIVTIGKPKLPYARLGVAEYYDRLGRLHHVRHTILADRYANDTHRILLATEGTIRVALEIDGIDYNSKRLAAFLRARELESRELSFIIGGPDGLPQAVRDASDYQWSLSALTLPHDLAMVVTLEALYRASTINAGLPYHR